MRRLRHVHSVDFDNHIFLTDASTIRGAPGPNGLDADWPVARQSKAKTIVFVSADLQSPGPFGGNWRGCFGTSEMNELKIQVLFQASFKS